MGSGEQPRAGILLPLLNGRLFWRAGNTNGAYHASQPASNQEGDCRSTFADHVERYYSPHVSICRITTCSIGGRGRSARESNVYRKSGAIVNNDFSPRGESISFKRRRST